MATSKTSTADATGEQLKKVQPTVFIGLGGTGKEILLRLRRRIILHRWNKIRLNSVADFPIAQFMYFDLDTQEAKESDIASATDLLGSVVKFQQGEILQDKLDSKSYFDNKSAYPLITDWFPSAQQMENIDPEFGAGQIRALARLQFFQKSTTFREMLKSKARSVIASLDDAKRLAALGLDTDRSGYRIVVVASSAGGTGSGSFLDAGFMARSLDDPEAHSVSLVLMLGSGFAKANATRVQANTFAALKELEFCMNRNHRPRYVDRWQEWDDHVPANIAPYDDVYLIDNANLGGERTEINENIYDMLADVLFEDFGNSDFAMHKRSVASNTQLHKAYRYFPPMPSSLPQVLSYSLAYSSLGQAIVETKAQRMFDRRSYETVKSLISDFYGLDTDSKDAPVKEEHLNEFFEKRLFLKEEGIRFDHDRRLKKFFRKTPDNLKPAISIHNLVSRSLLHADGISLFQGVLERIGAGIDDIRLNSDVSQWSERIVDLENELERDLIGQPGNTGQSPRSREVEEASRRIWEIWISDEKSGLSAEIYALVEDYQRGGILYALDLMRRIKDRLGEGKTGVIGNLTKARDEFRKWADQMRSALHKVPLENLKQLKGRRAVDRGEDILREGVKPLLENYAQFHLYALGCEKVIQRLADLSNNFLGRVEGRTQENEPIWTGLIGRIDEGRRRLSVLVREVTREIDIIDSEHDTPMRWCLDDGYKLQEPPSRRELQSLAKEVIETSFSGTPALFEMLGSSEGQLDVMSRIRQVLHERLFEVEERKLPSVLQVLTAQGKGVQKELKKLLDRALPWLDADTGRMAGFSSDRYKMLLAVADKEGFERAFGSHLKAVASHGITSSVVESGERGRLVCYYELSGIPLNVVIPLKTSWSTSYRTELGKMPLHNHWDRIRFPNPVVPKEADINRHGELVALFLKSLAFGLLKRGGETDMGAGAHEHHYFFEKSAGAWTSLGIEQAILSGERESLLLKAEEKVMEKEDELVPEQFLALSALFHYYGEAVYPPKVITDKVQASREVSNFQHAMAMKLAQQYLKRYCRQSGSQEPIAKKQRNAYRDALKEWTHGITGSRGDLDKNEVDIESAQPKRAILEERFTPEALSGLLKPVHPQVFTPSSEAGGEPPPIPQEKIYTCMPGRPDTKQGPFTLGDLVQQISDGALTMNHIVWSKTIGSWKPANQVPEIVVLFGSDDDDEPPPIPD